MGKSGPKLSPFRNRVFVKATCDSAKKYAILWPCFCLKNRPPPEIILQEHHVPLCGQHKHSKRQSSLLVARNHGFPVRIGVSEFSLLSWREGAGPNVVSCLRGFFVLLSLCLCCVGGVRSWRLCRVFFSDGFLRKTVLVCSCVC